MNKTGQYYFQEAADVISNFHYSQCGLFSADLKQRLLENEYNKLINVMAINNK
jgi:hypothetical protein